MSNKNKPVTSAENATPEQLQAALTQARADLEALAAQNADLQAQVDALKGAAQAQARAQSEHAGAGTHIRVSSAHKAGQHYRAGRLWTRTATDVAKDDFTAEQLAAMRADAQLVVVDL